MIIVGAGHNGLSCAAYLARGGKKVLVLEGKSQVGGACTLEEPWPGIRVSPCAYVVGLLHNQVISELRLKEHGFQWTPAHGGMFVPFEDGTSLQLWYDDARCEEEVKRFAPEDYAGWCRMHEVVERTRDRIRPEGDGDLWLHRHPTRELIEDRLGNDEEARGLLLHWSMEEFLDRYLTNEKFKMAHMGQGVIGTNADISEPGTASIYFHHASGRLDGQAGQWGYVTGGMGMVSFILCDIAREFGAVVATDCRVSKITPEVGVELEGGDLLRAPVVVSNADPHTTLRLLGRDAESTWRQRVSELPRRGCTMKVNLALNALPNFKARPGQREPHHFAQVNTPLMRQEWHDHFQTARAGRLPPKLWTELYFHTPIDPSVAPPGVHTMSVFSQYVPFEFTEGSWESRREEAGDLAIASVGRHCEGFEESILHREVMGPVDLEQKMGLTGGLIFHGELLPQYMWEHRLSYRTPMRGVYLCGASTHPGGSVMAVNGRNAALDILEDLQIRKP